MSVVKLTVENFEQEVLQAEKPVLVDFYADWCGPCKMMSPIVDEIAEEESEIKVCNINIDQAMEMHLLLKIIRHRGSVLRMQMERFIWK